jgi:hypothetical protein
MSKKGRHKKSKLLKKLNVSASAPTVKELNMSASAPTVKNSVAKPENYYAEDYRGYKITVVEITDGHFRGNLEIEVDNNDADFPEGWEYMPFWKDELEEQLATCRQEIDESCATMLEIEQEAKAESDLDLFEK